MSIVLDTARRAFESVPLYRRLYRVRPEIEETVPFISHVSFHRARGPLDCIAADARIMGAVPTYRRGSSQLPITVLESEEDWHARLDRFRHALASLGLCAGPGRRFAIVADDATGPFASELSNFLAWDRAEGSIVFLSSGATRPEATIAALAPDVVLLVSGDIEPAQLVHACRRLVIVLHVRDATAEPAGFDRLLVCDELSVIAAAGAGERAYLFDLRSVFPETEPASGLLAVTTSAFVCLPFVRYCLGRAVTVAETPD